MPRHSSCRSGRTSPGSRSASRQAGSASRVVEDGAVDDEARHRPPPSRMLRVTLWPMSEKHSSVALRRAAPGSCQGAGGLAGSTGSCSNRRALAPGPPARVPRSPAPATTAPRVALSVGRRLPSRSPVRRSGVGLRGQRQAQADEVESRRRIGRPALRPPLGRHLARTDRTSRRCRGGQAQGPASDAAHAHRERPPRGHPEAD
jgi:hypothetical protein